MKHPQFVIHACEQAIRFSNIEKWDDLSEKVKVQLGFNMGVMALGLGLSKEEGYMSLYNLREGTISPIEFRNYIEQIVKTHEVEVNREQIARPF